jgi:glutamyl endopeptidase
MATGNSAISGFDLLKAPYDRRQAIQHPDAPPYRRICKLELFYRSTARQEGTGWLAAPRVIVTAAHLVASRFYGAALAARARFPDGTVEVRNPKAFLANTGWHEKGAMDYDIGAIMLRDPISDPLAWRAASPTELLRRLHEIAGFPRGSGILVAHSGALVPSGGRQVFYDIDTEDGQSGSPILRTGDGVIVGLHNTDSAVRPDKNAGIVFDGPAAALLTAWSKL